MKRTVAAYTVLVGLTAIMIGLCIGEIKVLVEILGNYVALLP